MANYFNLRYGYIYRATEAGTLSSLHYYMTKGLSSGNCDTYVAINEKDSNGAGSHDEIASGVDTTPDANSWNSVSVSGSIAASTDYIFSITANPYVAFNLECSLRYDNVGDGEYYYKENNPASYSPLDDPWEPSTAGTNIDMSIYATYTATVTFTPEIRFF